MPRKLPPEGRWVTVPVQLREADVARLDAERGKEARSAWARSVLVAALEGQPHRPVRVRPGPVAKPRAVAAKAKPAREADPRPAPAVLGGKPVRYRCKHEGTRVIGGYCDPCGVRVASGGDLPPGYVPPWAAEIAGLLT